LAADSRQRVKAWVETCQSQLFFQIGWAFKVIRQEFLKPILHGERFQGHTVPLELLKDFSALEEMLVEVAKWRFKQERPNRERIQRNFANGIEPQLAGVEDGSAKLAIVLAFSSALLFPPENVKYFEQARTEIVNAIALSADNRSPELPRNLLSYFDRFGRGLRGGESIEFARGEASVRLNPEIRKRLIRSAQVEFWTEECALRARIYEADLAHDSFEFELSDGARAKAPLDDKYRDAVLDAMKGYHSGFFVLIQGVAQRDRADRLKGFESIEHVTPLDALDVTLRLEQMATLRDGWLDGKGNAPDKDKLTWLATMFETHFNGDLPLPYLYPTAEGGVQAEWTLNGREISLEIDLGKRLAEFQTLNLKNDTCEELTLSLDDPDAWRQLNERIGQLETQKAEESSSES
jgi:hypothetical protein